MMGFSSISRDSWHQTNGHRMLISGNRKSFFFPKSSLRMHLPLQPAHRAGPFSYPLGRRLSKEA